MNNHRIRKQNKTKLCPAGRQSFSYSNPWPEVFGCYDIKKDVDTNILDMFENIQAIENGFVKVSSNDFS